jgi:hypothetical protein
MAWIWFPGLATQILSVECGGCRAPNQAIDRSNPGRSDHAVRKEGSRMPPIGNASGPCFQGPDEGPSRISRRPAGIMPGTSQRVVFFGIVTERMGMAGMGGGNYRPLVASFLPGYYHHRGISQNGIFPPNPPTANFGLRRENRDIGEANGENRKPRGVEV